MQWCSITVLACCISLAACQQKVLVLVQDLSIANTHSRYFQQLSDDGYKLEIRAAEDKSLRLKDWDSWSYDQLVIFASGIQGACPAPATECVQLLTIPGCEHCSFRAQQMCVSSHFCCFTQLCSHMGCSLECHSHILAQYL